MAPAEVLAYQAQWLATHQIDYYLYAGDLFNDFAKTSRYFEKLQAASPQTKVYYIAGNHDMLKTPAQTIAHFAGPQYLHNRWVDLPNSDWRVIANNGWYDYSFSRFQNDLKQVARWKNVYWIDSAIDQAESDPERMAQVLAQVHQQLQLAAKDHRRVIFLTHFAPRHELLMPKPAHLISPRAERNYQMINAMMGSDHLGDLLEQSGIVPLVFYGHLHGIHQPLTHHGVTYYNQAVGVNNKRHHEWQAPTFWQQWVQTVRVIEG